MNIDPCMYVKEVSVEVNSGKGIWMYHLITVLGAILKATQIATH
jgi:hypothetical protein